MLRATIHAARREYKLEEVDSSRSPAEDESKDLPSDTIDAMRAQLGFLMRGVTCPFTMLMSATLITRMSRAAKKGGFYLPYVVHMRFAQLGGDRVAAVIAKAAGVTVEARFDDMPATDMPEVRLVADFLHLAYCRAFEAAAAYSTFDAAAAHAKAKVLRTNLPDAKQVTLADGTGAVQAAAPNFFFQHFDRLCLAARSGLSIVQLDAVDRNSIDAVAQRVSEGYYVGAAFQYVLDSRSQLFQPVASYASPIAADAKRQRQGESDEAAQLCRENTTLQSRLAKGAGESGPSTPLLAITDKRETCGAFNSRGGCNRGARCRFAHVCNFVTKKGANGEPDELCRGNHTRQQHP